MCEFCTKHGEGKKWYLQMKNYEEDLLHADLDRLQRRVGRVDTRLEWNLRFFENFVLPAIRGVPAARDYVTGEPVDVEPVGDAPACHEPTAPPDAETEVRIGKLLHYGQVIPIEDVGQVFDLADSITRLPCGCRYLTTGKTDRRYCFGLGMDKWGLLGRFPDAASSLEVLDKAEATRIVREYDAAGLMHSVWTGVTPYIMGLCNCDRDCGAYRGYIEKGGVPWFFRGEDVGQVDWDRCTGCKSCISQCQFGAMTWSADLGKVHINSGRCFGCGVCRAACSNDAIGLVPRETVATEGSWVTGGASWGPPQAEGEIAAPAVRSPRGADR